MATPVKDDGADAAGPRGRAAIVAAVLDAAERLFAADGPDAVSLRAIAAEAGVTYSLLNRHLGTRGAIVDALLARSEQRWRTRAEGASFVEAVHLLLGDDPDAGSYLRLLAWSLLRDGGAATTHESTEAGADPDPAPDRAEPRPAPDRAEPRPAPDRAEPRPAPDRAEPRLAAHRDHARMHELVPLAAQTLRARALGHPDHEPAADARPAPGDTSTASPEHVDAAEAAVAAALAFVFGWRLFHPFIVSALHLPPTAAAELHRSMHDVVDLALQPIEDEGSPDRAEPRERRPPLRAGGEPLE